MGMAAMLVVWLEQIFAPSAPRGSIWNSVTTGFEAFYEMFEIVKSPWSVTLASCTYKSSWTH